VKVVFIFGLYLSFRRGAGVNTIWECILAHAKPNWAEACSDTRLNVSADESHVPEMSAPFPASIAQGGTLPVSQKMTAMTDYPSIALVKNCFQFKKNHNMTLNIVRLFLT
jgi:hypothetical protein